jgi:aquaporin Z
MGDILRKAGAEFLGTFILVFFAVGSAVFGIDKIGSLGVALVFVVLLVTGRAAAPGFAGLAIGLVLTVIHLVGIPLDGTSVNPARSFGPAVFAGSDAMSHVWLFILAPLIGGAIAAFVAPLFETVAGVETTGLTEVDPTGANVPA